ncbi:MAG: hypothetical protein WC859_09910 [Elusimicrobiota bacterium]|jgi:outer membrane protein assembly factor BamD (BamD/ComL family)
MLKKIILIFAILAGSFVAGSVVVRRGLLLRYLDQHPDPNWVPPVEYYVGQGYYIKQNLTTAATYFIRVADQYPSSSFAEDAYVGYLECIHKENRLSRVELIQKHEDYLVRFPKGNHAENIRVRIGAYKSGL